MAFAVLRSSCLLRAPVLTTWVFSLLAWLCMVAKIVVSQVDMHTPFLDSVPPASISGSGEGSTAGPRATNLAGAGTLIAVALMGAAPMAIRVYNTLTRKKEDFVPLQGRRVSMFVCGITPQDQAHL